MYNEYPSNSFNQFVYYLILCFVLVLVNLFEYLTLQILLFRELFVAK